MQREGETVSNLNDMSLEELQKAKRDAEFALWWEEIKHDPQQLLQLIDRIEVEKDKRAKSEARHQELEAKFEKEKSSQ